jgi:hypothetical protein
MGRPSLAPFGGGRRRLRRVARRWSASSVVLVAPKKFIRSLESGNSKVRFTDPWKVRLTARPTPVSVMPPARAAAPGNGLICSRSGHGLGLVVLFGLATVDRSHGQRVAEHEGDLLLDAQALNTVVCAGPRMVGVGDVAWAAFESACRTVAPHRPMPFWLIGTASGRPGNQWSSAWISGLPGFRAVLSDARWRTAAWARFPAVASGLSGGTINAWLPLGIAWRRRCGGATMARTACWRLACLNPGRRGNARTIGWTEAAVRPSQVVDLSGAARSSGTFCQRQLLRRTGTCYPPLPDRVECDGCEEPLAEGRRDFCWLTTSLSFRVR